MLNDFDREDFVNDFAQLLTSYSKDTLSSKEKTIAFTPARILELTLMAYYKISLSTPYESLRDYPILSCYDMEDCISTVDLVESVGAKFAVVHGQALYDMFYEEFNKIEYNETVLTEYVLPSALTVAAYHMLRPVIKSTDKLHSKGVDVRQK